ncbi:hypothetical protein HS088_TW06G00771 [Tripterygium wilfordii]|uniref:non-specific serine/threonine protein kinase n=1 Tax=Tripterygium wilfordii TaxID=458696 RepID=A0A7J7DJQ3_TRIWF|nr:hypothetical protein HS088_TW06G00771 [Tripterygium wilfordii]
MSSSAESPSSSSDQSPPVLDGSNSPPSPPSSDGLGQKQAESPSKSPPAPSGASSSPPPDSSPPPSPPTSPPPSNSQSPPPSGSSSSNSTTSSPPPHSPPLIASPPPPSPSSLNLNPSTATPPPTSSTSLTPSPPPQTPTNKSPPPPSGQFIPPPTPSEGSSSAPAPSVGGGTLPSSGNLQPPPSSGSTSPPSPVVENSTPTSPGSNVTTLTTNSPPTESGRSSSQGSSNSSSPASSSSKTGNSDSRGSSPTQDSNGGKHESIVVGATVASVFVIALIAIFFVVSRRKNKWKAYAPPYMPPPNFTGKADPYYYSQGPPSTTGNSFGSQRNSTYQGEIADSGGVFSNKANFSYEEVMEITNGFSRQNIIGEGGFGCVFKGRMSGGKVVAVKQLKAGSGQGEREFRAEVDIISRVHHRHLVSLVGYCIAENNRLLIYEFVPNNTLEHHLHGLPVLDWPKRVKIALGSAKGLAYLHEDCHPKIIHRDIKSANILLDDDFEALANFGLARLNDTTQTHVSTRVMGTFGYLAPEYASSGKLTDRSDVFSFGVVLLELITGRKPVDPSQPFGDESLVEWARPILIRALETGNPSELVDPRLEKHYVEREMLTMIETAAACVRHSAPKRPRMVQVVRALDSEGEMSDLTNGVKYGQSTVYDSGQYSQDIMKFRMMALGSDDSTDYSTYSGDYTSKEVSHGPPMSWKSENTSVLLNGWIVAVEVFVLMSNRKKRKSSIGFQFAGMPSFSTL